MPGDDCLHDVLFLEAKIASKEWAVRTLLDHCRKRAKGRPVVIGLRSKNREGGMICVHTEDLDEMIDQRLKALHMEARLKDDE
jgi:hypothetical protein